MDYTIALKPIRIIDRRTFASKLNIPSLSILSVGHLPSRTLYREQAKFQHFAVVYIADGAGTYRVNHGETQQVRRGSLFFFYPDAVFDYGPQPGGSWDEYYFTIEGPRIGEWLRSWLIEPDRVKDVEIDDAQQSKIDRIFHLMDSGHPNNMDRAALLLESLLYEFMLSSGALPNTIKTDHVTKLMEDLSGSIYGHFDAQKLCKRHHISFSTLRRITQKYSGYPLNEYIHRMKIAEAKNILLNTETSVKELADALGFKDVFYFSRLFKKYVGVSPLNFRKSI
ncbi:helix-turn-helix domain-containing protein [Paenibacillus cremeus]|uniref:Helix-turn-helix domain-containing protein n=2 Tax=Paenibacillus cremeus TaxID=2163881 RepID=A0A559KA72_9BACL|nr:helix-turn-helix domain-containing protein [Paenibacillus cremeus]